MDIHSLRIVSIGKREFVRSELVIVIDAILDRFKSVTSGFEKWEDGLEAALLKNPQYDGDYIAYFCSRVRKAFESRHEVLTLGFEESDRRLDELSLLRCELPYIAAGIRVA